MKAPPEIFEFDSYKTYVRAYLDALPKEGHGELRRMATALRIHPVVISQIFRGDRQLTPEQACDLADHWGLSELSRTYFVALVQRARSGSSRLNAILDAQIKSLRKQTGMLKTKLPNERTGMSDEDKAEFYSSWHYSAVRLYFSIRETATSDEIARRFSLSITRVHTVVTFLLRTGLCVRQGNKVRLGPKSTHVAGDSPLITRHRLNWRFKALERQPDPTDELDLSYSGVMALSEKATAEIRKQIAGLLDKATRTAIQSDSETLMLLNVDWMKI